PVRLAIARGRVVPHGEGGLATFGGGVRAAGAAGEPQHPQCRHGHAGDEPSLSDLHAVSPLRVLQRARPHLLPAAPNVLSAYSGRSRSSCQSISITFSHTILRR